MTPNPPRKLDWAAPAGAAVAHVQVYPTEVVLKPGDKLTMHVRSFDGTGRFIREEKSPAWTVAGGTIENGVFVAGDKPAGIVLQAKVGEVAGAARVRIIPPLPWSEDFTSIAPGTVPPWWVNATGKSSVREIEGNKVLVKHADNAFTKRARAFIGPTDLHDYTVQADVSAVEKRRQMGDAGVMAQHYS